MDLSFDHAALWDRQKQDLYDRINQGGIPLVLFGRAYPVDPVFLRNITVPVQYICDNDPATWGSCLWGMEIVSPAKLQEIYSAYSVLILVPFENEIVPQLRQLPVPPVEIFRLDLYFEEDGTASYLKDRLDDIEDVYSRLADQASKDTYEAAMQYRINRDAKLLRDVVVPRSQQYFPNELDGIPFLNTEEIFVDVGAFTGDTVQEFISAVHGEYKAIHAFEPEPGAWERLQKSVIGFQNVTCWNTGVGDREGEIGFSFGGSSSKADQSGKQTVQIQTLDNLLGTVPVTYLKMDIEGMERSALRGARKIIQRYRPKLAICAYHSNADMILIPKLIWEIDPDYRIYCRHYSHALVETIFYAI